MLDLLLALYLLLILPGLQLRRSLRKRRKSDKAKLSRTRLYWKNIGMIAAPLAVLAGASWLGGRPAAALGLGLPLSVGEIWGLLGAALALAALAVAGLRSERKMSHQKRAEHEALLRNDDSLPRTAAQLRLYVLMALVIGIGWELLYRGFLVSYLKPHIGLVAAIALPALAYGAAHGYKNAKQFSLSIGSAFLFTIGFALTNSLWWLMLIHVSLPLLGAFSSYKTLKEAGPLAAAAAAP